MPTVVTFWNGPIIRPVIELLSLFRSFGFDDLEWVWYVEHLRKKNITIKKKLEYAYMYNPLKVNLVKQQLSTAK